MGKKKIRRNDRVEGEDVIAGTTNAAATPREGGVIPRHIPRGLEVLIQKAVVDPAFKKTLFEKRAEAAKAIGLKLTAAEEAMLAAVPLPHLEGIVAHTRISPKLRPAFLGYAAAAMLAALVTSPAADAGNRKSYNEIDFNIGRDTAEFEALSRVDLPENSGIITGKIVDPYDEPVSGALITIEELEKTAVTDSNGFYIIAPVPPGEFTIKVSRSGYGERTVRVVETQARSLTIVSLILNSEFKKPRTSINHILNPEEAFDYGVLEGSVTDAEGKPVASALVVAKDTNRFATTNAQGRYRILTIPQGTYDVKANHIGYDEVIKNDVEILGGHNTDLSFVLTSNYTQTELPPGEEPLIKGIRPDVPSERGK